MRAAVATAVACLGFVTFTQAQNAAAAIRRPTNIPAQELQPALQRLSGERDLQFVMRADLVGELRTNGAVGDLTFDEALTQLLGGTGLTYLYLDDRTVTIVPASRETARPTARPATGGAQQGAGLWNRFRLAQVDQPEAANATSTSSAASAQAPDGSLQIAEVIVTATKRAESVRDIPLSIAVIGNQDIERRGLIGMEDYLRSVPGVNQIDNGPLSNAIVIRGITTSPVFENFSSGPTVATYFDESPITGAAGMGQGGIDVRPVDIERIEVLRGPQGTAFGSSSLGGTLRIIPAKPELDGFSARVAASYSNTSRLGGDNSMVQGVFNIPVVPDKFALRAVGYRYDESGFYRNIAGIDPATIADAESWGVGDFVRGFVQDNVGQIVSTGGRLSASWQPTEKLNLSLSYLTQKIEQDGSPLVTIGEYEQARTPIAPQARVRGEAGGVSDTQIDLANVVLSYDLGWAALTSVASWIDSGSVYAVPAGFLGPTSTTGPSDFDSFTTETRLASQLDGRWQFLAGLFYEKVDDEFVATLDWPEPPSPFGSDPMAVSGTARELDQRAVFGEVSYDLTQQLTATVGARYFEYDKDEATLLEGGLFSIPLGASAPQVVRSTEDNSSFKAGLEYKPTQDVLLYASWAEGFRLGRPTVGLISSECDRNNDGLLDGTNVSIASTRRVDSDFLDNYEIGAKLTLLDRRLVVDTSIYHIEWDGLPIRAVAASCNLNYDANVGAATSDGVELQATVFVTNGLRLDFGGAYTKARLAADAPGLTPPAFDGDRLPGSPKVSANLAAQYDFDIAGHRAFIRADSLYAGEFYSDFQQTPLFSAGDYVKVDARVGVTINNIGVELFARNLTDEDAFTWRDSFRAHKLRPRTCGIQVSYSFE